MTEHLPVLIFLVPFLAALAVPVSERFLRLRPATVASGALLAAAALALYAVFLTAGGRSFRYDFGGWQSPWGIEWHLDAMSALMSLLLAAVSFCTVSGTFRFVKKVTGEITIPYYMALLFLMSGLFGMVMTHDLFNFFVFLEVSSLTGYALIAAGDPKRACLASFRYLLIGSLGASLYLLGVGYLYANTGTLNMSDMAARLAEIPADRSVHLGVLLIFLGLAIKIGLFPFHGWMPDAYTYASNPVTSLVAPLMTKVAIYGLIRISFWVLGEERLESQNFFALLKLFSAAAIIAGSAMAFMQKNLKRMLAYSSVAHIGLIMAGVAFHNAAALTGAVLHIMAHAAMKACLFLGVTSLEHSCGVRLVSDLPRARGKAPWTLAFLAVAALSMTGIPPLAGFFSKWYLFLGAFRSGDLLFSALIAGSSLLSALYFFRIIEQAFYREAPVRVTPEKTPLSLESAAGILAAAIVLLGLASPALFTWISKQIFEGVV